MKNWIKAQLKKNRKLVRWVNFWLNRLNPGNSFRTGKGNTVLLGLSKLKKTKLVLQGENNRVSIGENVLLRNCRILVSGHGNHIDIGDNVYMNDVELYVENDGNRIAVGKNSNLCGRAQLATIEGTRITVGEDCLFSSEISIRTGDSHSILDMDGKRINASEDVVIGDHVWVGYRVTCLKGTTVASNCIVGATATLTGQYSRPNCVIAGVPAKVVKENVNWCAERLACE